MSRKGEIYATESLTVPRYFQLVDYDATQLTSDVIAVFNSSEELDFNTKNKKSESVDELMRGDIEFFAHTTVTAGVRRGLWRRVASGEPVDYANALFKDVSYPENGPPETESYEADSYDEWVVWHVNGPRKKIGSKIGDYPTAELGHIFPPEDIIYRIDHGRYPGPSYYGQKH